jgi:hypothetical protein
MEWDAVPPTQDLPRLISSNDKRLVIGPAGPYYVALNVYLALNQYRGVMKNKLVRQAVNYAVDKNAIVQIYGGKRIAATSNQVIMPGNVGYIPNFNPYPNKNGSGDPDKAKQLLAKAGYPNGVDIKLVYSTLDPGPRVAQSLQASLGKAGFRVKLIPATGSDFYGKYMLVPSTAKQGVWDIAPPGWIPDWFGNNGRSVIQPLFTNPAPGSSDFGGYSSPVTNGFVDKALTATSAAQAATYWRKANAQLMKDAAAGTGRDPEVDRVPLLEGPELHLLLPLAQLRHHAGVAEVASPAGEPSDTHNRRVARGRQSSPAGLGRVAWLACRCSRFGICPCLLRRRTGSSRPFAASRSTSIRERPSGSSASRALERASPRSRSWA